ncbi:MAG: Fe-S oxidoreductase [Gammaproteobacteria bacterium]|nr:Fe-S oxidoreductase [Gammaproteobacteria bacterium]
MATTGIREGSLEAPTRHPIDWKNASFYDEDALNAELERVFDICHGCRRCVSLCQSFPTLFDLVDESQTMEVDGIAKEDYAKVVAHCYLCDLCYLTKCPYVPPHEWAVDFPHLMLRAKAVKHHKGQTPLRDKVITSTDAIGKFASLPVIVNTVNAANNSGAVRSAMEAAIGIHKDAPLPPYSSPPLRRRLAGRAPEVSSVQPVGPITGKVALFATCYGNFSEPHIGQDLVAVFEHNGIAVTLATEEHCCGMPKLELGDLNAVERAKEKNIAPLAAMVDDGFDIVAPVPSCVLMFKQELPLLFAHDPQVAKVARAFFDPFEYLTHLHKAKLLKTDFKAPLGSIAYHAACHQRVQNIGPRTRDILALVPDTQVNTIERCSGHDGTYAVKKETREASMKIVRPIVRQVQSRQADHIASDCPMAGTHIAHACDAKRPIHPLSLLRKAYGI